MELFSFKAFFFGYSALPPYTTIQVRLQQNSPTLLLLEYT